MSSSRQSTPPPASTITVLAADILATRANELLDQLACGQWAPARKLREALRTYSEVRIGTAMADGAEEILAHVERRDPQAMNVNDWPPAPPTERSEVRHA